jgi:MoxR-like ATPase
MATQNPIEQEGVYQLPEAQRDRFLFKLNVGYPSPEEEREIIYRMGVTPPQPKQILDTGDLLRMQEVAANNFVHHALVDYVVRIVTATREPEKFGMPDAKAWIAYGASPRASLGIIAASRALALIRGRDYVIPQDVVEVIPDVLRHRLVLTYDALADEISAETVVNRIMQTVALPQVNAIQQQGQSAPPMMPTAAAASGR